MKIRYQFLGSGSIAVRPSEIAGFLDRGAPDVEIVNYVLDAIHGEIDPDLSISPDDEAAICAAVRKVWEIDGEEGES